MHGKMMLATVIALLITSCVSQENSKNQSGIEKIKLSPAKEKRVERFLHPLPHEFRFDGEAYSFSPEDCSLRVVSNLSELERGFVDFFKKRWVKRFGKNLIESDGANRGLNLILLKNDEDLATALKESFASDLKYLKNRPNPEQAYLISCVENATGGLDVYLAANATSGLYYAMSTFEQLLDGLARESRIVVPVAKIIDWPDLKERGFCAVAPATMTEENGRLAQFAGMKFNLNHYWVNLRNTPDGKYIYNKIFQKKLERDRSHNIKFVPKLVHFDYLFGNGRFLSKRHDIMSKGAPGEDMEAIGNQIGRTFCYSNPESQVVMDQIFQTLGDGRLGDRLLILLSEHKKACKCEKCGGDQRRQFVKEVEHVVAAYKKAKRSNPDLKIDLVLSQGSYPQHYAFLDLIPKDISLCVYAGSGPNNTYKVRLGQYILTPQAEEIVSRGYDTAAVPQLGAALLWSSVATPNYASQLIKLRMSEIKDRGLQRVVAWLDRPFAQELNMEAYAEFAWNADGRNNREFLTAYATRKGWAKPERASEVIDALEYPIRSLNASNPLYSLQRNVPLALGTKPKWGSYHDILCRFEYSSTNYGSGKVYEELARLIKVCERAAETSEKLGNQELLAASRLTRSWLDIYERFALIHRSKDPKAKAKMRKEIVELADGLPKELKDWLTASIPDPYFKSCRKKSEKFVTKLVKEIDRMKR